MNDTRPEKLASANSAVDGDLLAAILDALPSGLFVTDRSGVVVLANPVAERILGRSGDGIVGRPLTSVRGELEPMLWPTDSGELLLLSERSGGAPMIIGFSSRELPGSDGEQGGHVVVLSDITDDKGHRREEAHRRRLADLGGIVATLAHEIRNPVFAISSLATLIGDEKSIAADAELVELTDRIRDEAARIARLVDDVLGFARKRELRRTRVDVVELVEGLLDDLSRALNRENEPVPLHLEVATGAQTAARSWNADRDALRQVLSNLIRNAVHAVEGTERRGPERTVEVIIDVDDGQLVIEVTDQGVGMDRKTLAKVFDSFFSTRAHGTGLGMPVARKLVQQHGGSLSVSSEPGEGTTVTVRLPK